MHTIRQGMFIFVLTVCAVFAIAPQSAQAGLIDNVTDLLTPDSDDLAQPDDQADAPTTNVNVPPTAGVTMFEQTVRFENHNRRIVYLRPTVIAAGKAPAVVMLHYRGGKPENMILLTRAQRLVVNYGAWVILPEAYLSRWSSDPRTDKNRTDDSTFLAQTIDNALAAYPIDSRRVYMAGFSAGAFMTERFLCEHSERIAAVAWSSATLLDSLRDACPLVNSTPVMYFHGTADPRVNYNGRLGLSSAPVSAAYYAGRDGCGPSVGSDLPNIANDGTTVHLDSYNSCSSGKPVLFYTINGGGHTWPGNDYQSGVTGRITQDIDATLLMWDFFKNYTR